MFRFFKHIGPGTLVAAAFIGPGTVTLCTIAGASFGVSLLWAMLLSVIATLVLQEMAARLGIISQKSLAEVIKTEITHPFWRKAVVLLMLSAIVVGNAAYESGNISGGVLGLETIVANPSVHIGNLRLNVLPLLLGSIAFVLLYIGNYKLLERSLVGLVLIMSLSFLIAALLTRPNLSAIFKGMFIPKFPKDSLLIIIGLIGTTVVPYNLFLHASLVKEKWKSENDLGKARKDTFISIVLGGLVSMAIIISASAIQSSEIINGADLALGLEPLYGSFSKYILAIGLFAAGITSAITAPLAAAYVVKGCLDWKGGLKSMKFRSVWMLILLLGILFSSLGINPIKIIKFAQVTNGILLPIIAGFLVWIVNKKAVLGNFKNTKLQNAIAILILIITIFLGFKSIFKVFNLY